MTVPRDLDELLAHADWVRRLSLQLCRDQHAAADAAQDTWLQSLRARPDTRGQARGFLATVLRNVVRMRGRADRRVQRRERAVARRCDLTESAADACARAELQQFVVREVLALPEPQKALVLLHYFEGHAVADLAGRHGITADAVRAHLRRARDTLRLRLQSRDGPARRAFGALLLSHSSSVSWLLVGATMAIGIKTKLVGAAAVVVIGAWALWQLDASAAQPTASAERAAGAPVVTAPVANASAQADGTVQRIAADAPAAAVEPVVRCQLVGLHSNVAWTTPFEVRFPAAGVAHAALFVQPDAHGAFTIEAPSGGADQFAARLVADDPSYADVDLVAQFVVGRHADHPYEIPVQPVARVVGTVVDFQGTPVPGARVAAFAWVDGRPRGPHSDATTSDEGAFRIKVPMESDLFLVALAMREMAAGERIVAQGTMPGTSTARDDLLPAFARTHATFGACSALGTLTLGQPSMITGELRDPQGRPVPGELVYWSPDATCDLELEFDLYVVGTTWDDLLLSPKARTDEQGRFRLPARAGTRGTLYLAQGPSCFEPFVRMRQVTAPADVPIQLGGNTVVLRVVQRGVPVPDAYLRWEKSGGGEVPRTDERGELRLLRERAQVEKVTILQRGGAKVDLELPLDTAPDRPLVIELGDIVRSVVTFEVTSAVAVQQFGAVFRAAGAKSSIGLTVSRDAEGRYRCEVVPGDYQVWVGASNRAEGDDRFVCAQRVQFLVPPGGARMPITLQHGGRLRIQVRDADAVHLAGVVTLTGPDGAATKPGLDGADGYYLREGKLPGNGPATTGVVAAGTWQVALDLGTRGVLRRTVEVRACEIAEVDVSSR